MQVIKKTLRKIKNAVPQRVYSNLVRPVLRRTLDAIYGGKGAKVDIGGQGVFRFSPEYMFRGLENFGTGHNGGFARCIRACAGKSVFLDLGAHIGYYSLPASRVLRPGGRVYAFEPDGGNFASLSRHIRYNGIENIEVCNVVVGGTSRSGVEFYEHKASGSPFGGLIVNKKKDKEDFTVCLKEQVSLDEFCAKRGIVPDVMKIDVEGGELGVLQGAASLLRAHNPKIFLSLHPSHLELMGHSVGEVLDLVRSFGYELYSLDEDGPWKPGTNECVCVKAR